MKPKSDPKERNPAGGPGFGNVQTMSDGPRDDGSAAALHASTPANLELLLSRLERVRKAGAGWTARCPAHEDRTASLSVAMGREGKLVLHCFAMCSIHDVLGSIGLTVADLFPRRLKDVTPEQRREARRMAQQANTIAATGVLEREAYVVLLCATDVAQGRPLLGTNLERLGLAHERIAAAHQVLAGGRHD
ncbi:MAG: hypothetical protein R3F18_18350 [Lysobacterales bacterium]|nr:hypothetical protein [Xanthomonadales bacterium]